MDPNSKVLWGGELVDDNLLGAAKNLTYVNRRLDLLERVKIKEFCSARPISVSTGDVLQFCNNSSFINTTVDGTQELRIKTKVQGLEINLDVETINNHFGLPTQGDDYEPDTSLDGAKIFYSHYMNPQHAKTPPKFDNSIVRRRHLVKAWDLMALVLHRCFDSNQGGADQISMERWRIMVFLNSLEDPDEPFNWGKYIFLRFVDKHSIVL